METQFKPGQLLQHLTMATEADQRFAVVQPTQLHIGQPTHDTKYEITRDSTNIQSHNAMHFTVKQVHHENIPLLLRSVLNKLREGVTLALKHP